MNDYPDLPDWLQPGEEIAVYSARTGHYGHGGPEVSLGTVTRITAKQLVVTVTSAYGSTREDRFYREPKGGLWTDRQKTYQLIQSGSYGSTFLLPLQDPRVVKARFARDMAAHWEKLAAHGVAWQKSDASERTPELAMELLDKLENELRRARRTVEAATAPEPQETTS